MTDHDFFLVDCSGRQGALQVDKARFLRGDQVLEWLRLSFHEYCIRQDASRRSSVKWGKDRGSEGIEERMQEWYDRTTTKDYWYDHHVKCYPVSCDGSIVKDHWVMREIWLSYEGTAK